MRKIHYTQIYLAKPETEKLHINKCNEWNETQKDQEGNWIKGAKRLRPSHNEIYKALLVLLIKNSIYRQNVIYVNTGRGIYNVDKPLIVDVYTSDIKNMTLRGLKNGICFQTIKNYLNRLEEAGFIKRKWKRASEKFEIEFTPSYIVLKDPETQHFIKNIGFENYSNSIIYSSKIENLQDNTINKTNINNKIIHPSITDENKRKILFYQKQEQPEDKNKGLQDRENAEPEIKSKASIEAGTTSGGERLICMGGFKTELFQIKKKAAYTFYVFFITVFWDFWKNLYLPETAPNEMQHYITQSIETLMNDDYYFGNCTNQQEIEYQHIKLINSLKSTRNWYESKKRTNENFSFRYLYPNVFLKNEAGKNSMSFKNAVAYEQYNMSKHGKLQSVYESAMKKELEKKQGKVNNTILSNLLAWVHKPENKQSFKELSLMAQYYLSRNHPDLLHIFQADVNNRSSIQKVKDFNDFDIKLISECFNDQAIIKEQIENLLPLLQKRLQANYPISNKMMAKFRIIGYDKKPVPKEYDIHALKYIEYILQ
jgi:hypothetical protein